MTRISTRILALAACVVLLMGCGGGTSPSASPSPSPVTVLALGEFGPVQQGLSLAVVSLKRSSCDSGQGLIMETRWTNSTAQFIQDAVRMEVVSPDNQHLNRYIGVRKAADSPAYDGYLPQGFPPNETVTGFICIATGGQVAVSQFVGTLPDAFVGWNIRVLPAGPRWLVK